MKKVVVEISDDPVYCFDPVTKRLCRFVGISSFGCRWWCILGEPVELFSNTEEEGLKLQKCSRCLEKSTPPPRQKANLAV